MNLFERRTNTKGGLDLISAVLGISIAAVFSLFVSYGFDVLYPVPAYDEFCSEGEVGIEPTTEGECIAQNGSWMPDTYGAEGAETEVTGWCDMYAVCSPVYEKALQNYSMVVLPTFIAIGVLALLFAIRYVQRGSVQLGLALGGSFLLLGGGLSGFRYFTTPDGMSVVVLGLALAVLVWLGMQKQSSTS